MTVGYPMNKAALDARLGMIVVTLEDTFQDVGKVIQFLQRNEGSLENLQAEYGYTLEEAQTIRSVIFSLWQLRQVAYGQATVPTEDNFMFNNWMVRGFE